MARATSDMAGKDQLQPAVQVVGFHVEGGSPSPALHPSLLAGMMTAGSPTPVIIPPTFQVRGALGATASLGARLEHGPSGTLVSLTCLLPWMPAPRSASRRTVRGTTQAQKRQQSGQWWVLA